MASTICNGVKSEPLRGTSAHRSERRGWFGDALVARYFEIIAGQQEIDGAVARAVAAQRSSRHVPVDERYASLFKRALAGDLSGPGGA